MRIGAISGTEKLKFRIKGSIVKGKENQRKKEEKQFEKPRIKFESGREGRKVTLVGASENQTKDDQKTKQTEMKTTAIKFSYESDLN